MGDGRLQSVEAVIKRQKRVLAERNDRRLLLCRQNCRTDDLRTHRRIVNKGPLAPLGDCFLLEAMLRG